MSIIKTFIHVVAVAALSSACFAQTQQITVQVSDRRPFAAMALKLEQLLHTPINYEDPALLYSGDLEDVTAEVVPDPAKRKLIPNLLIVGARGGELKQTVTFDSLASELGKTATAVSALNAVVAVGLGTLNQRFSVVRGASGEIFIEPSGIRDLSGKLQDVVPLLATTISFPEQSRNAFDTLKLILQQVNVRRSVEILPGTMPIRPFAQLQVTIGAQDEAARSVIVRLLQLVCRQGIPTGPFVAPTMSYALLSDPNIKKSAFNLHFVSPTIAPGPPVSTIPSTGNSAAFFDKKP